MARTWAPELLKQGRARAPRATALRVLGAALEAVEPARAVERYLTREGSRLRVGEQWYDLDHVDRVLVIGAGKASGAMALAVERALGDRLAEGVVNVKYGYTVPTSRVELREAGHPLPDAEGVAGTRSILELLREATERDLVLCLISGGGSALLVAPQDGISLEDLQRTTTALLRSGATINEVNAIRKHLDGVKGGGLARAAAPAQVVSLILSDVVRNPLDIIASGPTVPDASTFADAAGVVDRFSLWDLLPEPVADRLRRGRAGECPETAKPGDPAFARVQNLVVGSNELAAEAAEAEARRVGLNALLLTTYVEGEAREVGKVLAALARDEAANARPLPRPACLIAGGETTVAVRGSGLGGRSQELALSAALNLDGLHDVLVIGAATDGTDGPTDAAGAIADGTTLRRARELGLDASAALADNDSYHFFEPLGDLIKTGPTNTNVNDLMLVFAF